MDSAWTTITFRARISAAAHAELEKRLPELLEEIGISEYNFDTEEYNGNESEA